MLTWEPDKERALESIFLDSIPFILFAPDEFKDELIMRLRGLYSSCKPTTTDKFIEEEKHIKEMLKDFDFGELANVHIANLQTKMKPFTQTLSEHSLKLKELEKIVKGSRKKEPILHKPKNAQINEIVISQAPIHTQRLENNPSINGKLNYRQIIIDCLKNSANPINNMQIMELTGLNKTQVGNALTGIRTNYRNNIKIEKMIVPVEYNNSVTNSVELRNFKLSFYSWVEDEPEKVI